MYIIHRFYRLFKNEVLKFISYLRLREKFLSTYEFPTQSKNILREVQKANKCLFNWTNRFFSLLPFWLLTSAWIFSKRFNTCTSRKLLNTNQYGLIGYSNAASLDNFQNYARMSFARVPTLIHDLTIIYQN